MKEYFDGFCRLFFGKGKGHYADVSGTYFEMPVSVALYLIKKLEDKKQIERNYKLLDYAEYICNKKRHES